MTEQALKGIKVVDFGWAGVAPVHAKIFANHGAEVIRIETGKRADILRTTQPFKDNIVDGNHAFFFNLFNDSKYGITLNLKHPKGLAIAKRLVAWADVVVQGYVPGTMGSWGLDYDELVKVKPDIIMVNTSNLGQTGPYAMRRGYGPNLSAYSGFCNMLGWPDRWPVDPGMPYTDVVAPLFGLAAVIAALDYRRRTGKGQYIDLSQHEAAVHFLAPLILDYTVNGRVADRLGNCSPYAAPHGVYPCHGEDKWCAIAVFSDQEWEAFGKAMGNPAWTTDPKFATLLNRKGNEDELDELIGGWTRHFTAEQVTEIMQASGVCAGIVETCADVFQDPQLKHRHHFWELEHKVIGRYNYESLPFKLSKTPAEVRMPAPCLGEHNEYVYTKIIDISYDEFIELQKEGVFD